MTPDDPRHGSYAGAQLHARTATPICDPCREARRRYQRHLSYDHDRGAKRRISSKRAWVHLQRLKSAGLCAQEIASQAGVSKTTVWRASGSPQPVTMEARTAAAILSVPVPSEPGGSGYIPRLGFIRRVQALNAIGWPRAFIAKRIGVSQANLTSTVTQRRTDRPATHVQASTWHKMAALYDELSMTPGPSGRSILYAKRRAYAPPLAWNNIDDPNEKPTGIATVKAARRPHDELDPTVVERLLEGQKVPQTTHAERKEAMRRWLAMGNSERSLCKALGWKDGRYLPRKVEAPAWPALLIVGYWKALMERHEVAA